MTTQTPAPTGESFGQKLDMARVLCLFPASTLMAISRKRVGFDTVKPSRLMIMSSILLSLATLAGSATPAYAHAVSPKLAGMLMALFALCYLGIGMYQRRNRWNEYCQGQVWYSHSTGVSYLEDLTLPDVPLLPGVSWLEHLRLPTFLTEHRRLYRYVEPIAWLIVGLFVSVLSPVLGGWINLSAIALKIFEDAAYEASIDQAVAVINGIATAQAQSAVMNQTKKESPKPLKPEATAGIVIGVTPEITQGIERMRRAEQEATNALPVWQPPAHEEATVEEAVTPSAPWQQTPQPVSVVPETVNQPPAWEMPPQDDKVQTLRIG